MVSGKGGGAGGWGQQHQQRQRCPGEWLGHRAKGRLQGDGADTNAHVADEEDEVVKRRGRTSFELPAARPSAGVGFGLNWIDLSQTPPPRHSGVSEYQAGSLPRPALSLPPRNPQRGASSCLARGRNSPPIKSAIIWAFGAFSIGVLRPSSQTLLAVPCGVFHATSWGTRRHPDQKIRISGARHEFVFICTIVQMTQTNHH